MHELLEATRDPGWVLSHEGYNVLTESAVESRFAFGNGFLGMRAERSVSRGPTQGPLRADCVEKVGSVRRSADAGRLI
jgi:trehalose/maltose hydrolase-like predicted phosphorylase